MMVMKSKISGMKFGLFSPQAVKSLARVRVVSSELYDADGYPVTTLPPQLG